MYLRPVSTRNSVCSLGDSLVIILLFIATILTFIRKYCLICYVLGHPSESSGRLQGWPLPLLWTSDAPLKLSRGGWGFCRPGGAGRSSFQRAPAQSTPAERTCKRCGQQLQSCVIFLHDVNSLNKRNPLAALKKKKKSLVCTFMCLGNQEIPHYCSLDILRSFTSTGHETGSRIIHKSLFKVKCVRSDIGENVPKLTCHPRTWVTAQLPWKAPKKICVACVGSSWFTV